MSLSEEQKPLEDFFQTKNLKVRNEMLDDVSNSCDIRAFIYSSLSASQ